MGISRLVSLSQITHHSDLVNTLVNAVRESGNNAIARLRAPVSLHVCDRVGRRARCYGQVQIENAGSIEVGDDIVLSGRAAAVQIAAGPRARIGMGDNVTIEHGTFISARSLVSFGSRIRIGPHCVISDAKRPFPLHTSRGGAGDARAIMVGNDVWIGAGVTLMPGVRIGERAVVAAESVVTFDVPADAMVVGDPATILRIADRQDSRSNVQYS